jgi:protein-S-isoprenylcysteine O-methyltransferase Ste14
LGTKRIAERQSPAANLAHRFPVAMGYWLMAYPRFSAPLNRPLLPHTDLTMAVGAAVCLTGLLITLWARRTLAGNWSSDVTFKENHELIRRGPYRYVRHPIYTGLFAMCVGTAIDATLLHVWIGAAVILLGFWIKLLQEERLLIRHFPDQYPQYRREVKALIPWIL